MSLLEITLQHLPSWDVQAGVPVQSRPPLVGTPAWTSQLSPSTWCHMIQNGHVTPTATSCHPLTKAERFCRKFGNLFHHNLTLCAECYIRNYVSRVQKHSLPKYLHCFLLFLIRGSFCGFVSNLTPHRCILSYK